MKPTSILVATDLSQCSRVAVLTAAEYGKLFGAKVTLVHAFDPSPYVPPVAIPGPADLLESAAAEVKRSLEKSCHEERDEVFGADASKVDVAVLRHHAPGHAISDYAREIGADLIIVGSHGRTGLSRVFLGSVAERIVRAASCSVLVVREPKA